ncbi:hypothetical protein [Marinicauda salina]|jgi:hypothetical protein|uniref:hypothetical protein n=1 Tax=Marinicauda salina TaxID=2135793 RepID=UPI0013048C9B|nr:hypothetical protein [Marinicauda salina]
MKRLLKTVAGLALGAAVLCAFAPAETRLVGAAVAAAIGPDTAVVMSIEGGRS